MGVAMKMWNGKGEKEHKFLQLSRELEFSGLFQGSI
jgi:hypothetical protein